MISCITISKNRLEHLKSAVQYYIKQDFSKKEFILGYYEDDQDTKDWVDGFDFNFTNENKIRTILIPQGTSTGIGRNILIQSSNYDTICIWDDDDYYHPTRLSEQYKYLETTGKGATTLSSLLIYSEKKREVRLGYERKIGWEGSLMARKSILPNYEDAIIGEDTPLVQALYDNKHLGTLFKPDLYIYILHDNNTSSPRHLENIFDYSYPLNTNKNREVKQILGKL